MKQHRPPRLAAPVHAEQTRNQLAYRKALRSPRFARFRRWLLSERPVCQDCGRVTATEVHHVLKLAAGNIDALCDPEACLCLCKSCHSKRTIRGE